MLIFFLSISPVTTQDFLLEQIVRRPTQHNKAALLKTIAENPAFMIVSVEPEQYAKAKVRALFFVWKFLVTKWQDAAIKYAKPKVRAHFYRNFIVTKSISYLNVIVFVMWRQMLLVFFFLKLILFHDAPFVNIKNVNIYRILILLYIYILDFIFILYLNAYFIEWMVDIISLFFFLAA